MEIEVKDIQRFWNKTRINLGSPIINGSHCVEWTGAMDGRDRNRGKFYCKFKQWRAYRFSFYITNGWLPGRGREIAHRCDNPKCVEPCHLECITHSQNTKDAYDRGLIQPGQKMKIKKYSLLLKRALRQKEHIERVISTYRSVDSLSKAAKILGMSPSGVSRIVNRNRSTRFVDMGIV